MKAPGRCCWQRKGDLALEHIHAGGNFAKQSELVRQLDMICGSFPRQGSRRHPDCERQWHLCRPSRVRNGGEAFSDRGALHCEAGAWGKRCCGWALAVDLRCAGIARTEVAADFARAGRLRPNDGSELGGKGVAAGGCDHLRAQSADGRAHAAPVEGKEDSDEGREEKVRDSPFHFATDPRAVTFGVRDAKAGFLALFPARRR